MSAFTNMVAKILLQPVAWKEYTQHFPWRSFQQMKLKSYWYNPEKPKYNSNAPSKTPLRPCTNGGYKLSILGQKERQKKQTFLTQQLQKMESLPWSLDKWIDYSFPFYPPIAYQVGHFTLWINRGKWTSSKICFSPFKSKAMLYISTTQYPKKEPLHLKFHTRECLSG